MNVFISPLGVEASEISMQEGKDADLTAKKAEIS